MRPSAGCPFFRRPLCHKQTTTRSRELEPSIRKVNDGKCNRTVAIASQRPALIGEAIETVLTENEMVEQPDAQQVSSFSQSCGERPILDTRRGIS